MNNENILYVFLLKAKLNNWIYTNNVPIIDITKKRKQIKNITI